MIPRFSFPLFRYDLLNVALFILGYIFQLNSFYLTNDILDPLNTENVGMTNKFVALTHFGFYQTVHNMLLGLNCVLCTFRLFKYFAISHSMSLLLRTFFASIPRLMSMIFFLVILAFGYAMALYLIFGARIERLRTIWNAFIYCIRAVFGEAEDVDLMSQGSDLYVSFFLLLTYEIIMKM